MSLTPGTGPLAPQRAGELDSGTHVSGHALYLEPLARRVRGYLGGELVVDSTEVRLLHESGALPSGGCRSATSATTSSPRRTRPVTTSTRAGCGCGTPASATGS